jgi:uncharacterized membrane protein
MDMLSGETEVRDYALERLMMLSDGVFAIAMTLLALDLRPEPGWDHTLSSLWGSLFVPFQAFFWSFFAAAVFRTGHRRQYGAYLHSDGWVTFFNLVLLGEIVLLPTATRIFTEIRPVLDGLTVYLGLFALIGVTNAASFLYVALCTDILRPPIPGPAGKAMIAFQQMVLPVGMTALGVLSSADGLHWLLAMMPAVLLLMRGLRAAARAIDQRLAA